MRRAAMVVMALLAGCAVPAARADAPVERQRGIVEVRLGGTARLGGLTVRPIAVVEDSRCPSDVACIWAGRLRLRAAVSGIGETELILGQPLALSGGGSLTLVAALPAPRHRPPSGPATRFAFRRD